MDPWLEHVAHANFLRSSDTAHDLKTPLNVSVLNLELLRMRVRKLVGDDDETLAGYARAIDLELRRMGKIFDAFFLLSTPPKNEGEPVLLDIAPICTNAASVAGYALNISEPCVVRCHESRI